MLKNKGKGLKYILFTILLTTSTFISSYAASYDIVVEEVNEATDEYLGDVPMYFQNDYRDIAFGDSTVAQQGNLVTCLSMLESYYLNENVTPDIFISKHPEDCSKGIKGLNSNSISKYASLYNVELTETNFDFTEALEHIRRYQAKIILKIPHNSIFGTGTSYMLLTGIKDGGFIVCDPNKDNIDNFATKVDNYYIYDAYLVSVAASNSSIMYIME